MKTPLFLVWLAIAVPAFPVEFQVNKDRENQVIFNSDSPLNKMHGVTSAIDGYVLYDHSNPLLKNELYFQVDLTTLDTGIKARNRQMQENFLHTEKFQYAFFRGTIQAIDTLETDKLYQVVVNGLLNVHGVEKPYTINGAVTRENSEIHVASYFEMALAEHNIKSPGILFIRSGSILQIEVDFYLKQQE